AYQNELSGFRALLGRWVMDTDDKGRFPESIAMYDSDMEPYLKTLRVRKPEAVAKIEANIALMKQWRMEGK
ncbi:MAG: sulfatase, partial [Opitutales bacterium]|nr:sulfatase [Opitutales bacterium]